MGRTCKQAIFLVQEDDAAAASIMTLLWVLQAHIRGAREKAEALAPDDQLDSTGSFSLLSTHQIGDVRVSRMTVYFLIWERTC